MKVAALSETVTQRTENCLTDNRSMFDLTEDEVVCLVLGAARLVKT